MQHEVRSVMVHAVQMVDQERAPASGEYDPGIVRQRGGQVVSHAANAVHETPHDAALKCCPSRPPYRIVGQGERDRRQLGGAGLERRSDQCGTGRDGAPLVDSVSVYDLESDRRARVHHDDAAWGRVRLPILPHPAAASRSGPRVSGVSYASSNGSGIVERTRETDAPVRAFRAAVTASAVAGATEARPTCSMGASGRWEARASCQATAAEGSVKSTDSLETENTWTSSSSSKRPPFTTLLPTSRVRCIASLAQVC